MIFQTILCLSNPFLRLILWNLTNFIERAKAFVLQFHYQTEETLSRNTNTILPVSYRNTAFSTGFQTGLQNHHKKNK